MMDSTSYRRSVTGTNFVDEIFKLGRLTFSLAVLEVVQKYVTTFTLNITLLHGVLHTFQALPDRSQACKRPAHWQDPKKNFGIPN
jgi:hypothetical protein